MVNDATMTIHDNLLQAIGNTPLLRLNRIGRGLSCQLLGKLEMLNPGGSVKDRIGLPMIEAAEAAGLLKPGGTIVEPTSGNTGIGLAFTCAAKGYKLTVTMPESMSLERRRLLKAFGANLVLTPADKGMAGAIGEAERIYNQAGGEPKAFMPQQFKNPANPEIHRKTTAEEIWRDTGGKADILVKIGRASCRERV